MSKRGSTIEVPESWLEQCRQWRDSQELSLQAAGALLGRAVSRGRPFGISTVRRYLAGEVVTDDLTHAFAKVMNVAPPVRMPRPGPNP